MSYISNSLINSTVSTKKIILDNVFVMWGQISVCFFFFCVSIISPWLFFFDIFVLKTLRQTLASHTCRKIIHYFICRFPTRRALFDLYTADQVHLLPDYPRNASGSLQVAFYVQQPRGLFIGNTSILPGKTLVNIVKTYKSEIETAIGANISRVEAFIQSPSTPTTTSPTTLPTKVPDSNDTTKWIAVGVGIGVFVLIFFILLLIFW